MQVAGEHRSTVRVTRRAVALGLAKISERAAYSRWMPDVAWAYWSMEVEEVGLEKTTWVCKTFGVAKCTMYCTVHTEVRAAPCRGPLKKKVTGPPAIIPNQVEVNTLHCARRRAFSIILWHLGMLI